jgi:glycosyltransferase involved in cell wall biosynthesis
VGIIRIALLTEIPAPFRIPLFNALAERPDVELDVLFLSERDPKRPYPIYADEFGFRWRVLRGWELVRGGRWLVFSRGVFRVLRRLRPDVIVIGGWNQPAFWVAAAYSRVMRVPLVAWVESTARDSRPGSPLTELPKRAIVAASRSFLVPGRASATYLEGLGAQADRIALAPNAVDMSRFRDEVDSIRAAGGPDPISRPLVLYVGRLDVEKGVDVLLQAAEQLEATIAIIGRGPEEERLRRAAPPNVRFLGWVDRDELPRWYAGADVFVLPSLSDQWGMVLNEAAAAGLPLVSSDAPGAAQELIEDGVNGFCVAAGDAGALRDAIQLLLADASLRASAGERSREIAAGHTAEHWAASVAEATSQLD